MCWLLQGLPWVSQHPSPPFPSSLPTLLLSISCYSDSTEDDIVDNQHGLPEPALLQSPTPTPAPGLVNLHLSF